MSESPGSSPRQDRSPTEGDKRNESGSEMQSAGTESAQNEAEMATHNTPGDRPDPAISGLHSVKEETSTLPESTSVVITGPQLHSGSNHATENTTESRFDSDTETPLFKTQTETPVPETHTDASEPIETPGVEPANLVEQTDPTNVDADEDLDNIPPAKRQRTELPEFDPTNPSGLIKEQSSKRVPGKLIEKLWEKLDPTSVKSFERVSSIVLNRVLENLRGEGATERKIADADRVINANYMDLEDPWSFRARLGATNFPPPSSMQSLAKMSAAEASQIDILNADQLLRKKQYLETYMLAELKQLNELERHYRTISDGYELDLQYLQQFRRTTAVNKSQMQQEVRAKREALQLDSVSKEDNGIVLLEDTGDFTKFKPDGDDDVRDVLQELSEHLTRIAGNTAGLTTLNDKLEVLYNILDTV